MAYVGSENARLIRVGDIVTGYYSGYHRVEEIQRRYLTERDFPTTHRAYHEMQGHSVGDEYTPIIKFRRICDAKMLKFSKRQTVLRPCDGTYCRIIDEDEVYRMIARAAQGYQELIAEIRKV